MKITGGQLILRILRLRLVRIVVLLIFCGIGIGMIRSVIGFIEKRGVVAERQAVLDSLKAKNVALERELQNATSTAFIEKTARNKLGLVKEGETVVILDKDKINALAASGEDSLNTPPTWRQWWALFF